MKEFFLGAIAVVSSLFLCSHGYLTPFSKRPTFHKLSLDAVPNHKRNHSFATTVFTAAILAFGVDSAIANAYEHSRQTMYGMFWDIVIWYSTYVY